MLANVTERTREIGIRRALGATRADIVQQFIFEALFLTVSGGAIGIGLGILIPYIVTFFTEMRAIITIDSLVMAFSLSAITGLIFGIYPAMRAAAMSPIEALRHE
jgi:putative ABC transport system permease protein